MLKISVKMFELIFIDNLSTYCLKLNCLDNRMPLFFIAFKFIIEIMRNNSNHVKFDLSRDNICLLKASTSGTGSGRIISAMKTYCKY